jgi:hypothetical protein
VIEAQQDKLDSPSGVPDNITILQHLIEDMLEGSWSVYMPVYFTAIQMKVFQLVIFPL